MNEVVHTSPTIGSNVEEVVWKNIHFLMWDIGGQETLRSSWNTYYSNAQVHHTLLHVYSYTFLNNAQVKSSLARAHGFSPLSSHSNDIVMLTPSMNNSDLYIKVVITNFFIIVK